MANNHKHLFVLDEEAFEDDMEISVRPEKEHDYRAPQLGDQIVIPDLDDGNDDDDPYLAEEIEQDEDSDIFTISLNKPILADMAEGSQVYSKPR